MRNKLSKGELVFESNKNWIKGFKNASVFNKKLYTRIVVDEEVKVFHNIFAILENEKTSTESNKL